MGPDGYPTAAEQPSRQASSINFSNRLSKSISNEAGQSTALARCLAPAMLAAFYVTRRIVIKNVPVEKPELPLRRIHKMAIESPT